MKVVINKQFGGFGLSHEAVMEYARLAGFNLYAYVDSMKSGMRMKDRTFKKLSPNDKNPYLIYYLKNDLGETCNNEHFNNADWFHERDIQRNDPILVKVVEKLRGAANGDHASLKIIEIPDGTEYEISEYDGMEHIAEKHRTWE